MENHFFIKDSFQPFNRAFLFGDSVLVTFFIRNSKLILAEECYFYLMASMRKMRMKIPLTYTLEFFQNLLENEVLSTTPIDHGKIYFRVYRDSDTTPIVKSSVSYHYQVIPTGDVLSISDQKMALDVIKEVSIHPGLFSGIKVHSAENIYASIYAQENDLDDVILLNANKRIARAGLGNLLFLEQGLLKVPKTTEGAYISPLMEHLVTFVHQRKLAELVEVEMNPFESQKADEILLVSDERGLFLIDKIRNKSFETKKWQEIISLWKASFI